MIAHPISINIDRNKIVEEIPQKNKAFANIIPGLKSTYIFDNVYDYNLDYQNSYYAITTKKAGWDCFRHYEIIANGCIPYFVDIEQCPQEVCTSLPKRLIIEAMNLKGVNYNNIDFSVFDKEKYFDLLNQILEHSKEEITTERNAKLIINKFGLNVNDIKVLYYSYESIPDYQRCNTLGGFKSLLGENCIDNLPVKHLYKNYKLPKEIYGKGFNYSHVIEGDIPDKISDKKLLEMIERNEFDLVVIGSIHRDNGFYEKVKKTNSSANIALICGEDIHNCTYQNHITSENVKLFSRGEHDESSKVYKIENKFLKKIKGIIKS